MLLLKTINICFTLYSYMLFISILGSWLPKIADNKIMLFIRRLTDPYLNIFRSFIPSFGGIDFSPILAIFILRILNKIVLRFFL